MSERILVVEDERVLRTNLCEFIKRAGYEVEGVGDGEAALTRVLEVDFTVVLTDLRMPKMDGITLLERIVVERPETFVLIMTAYASVDSAVEALRLGAYDYFLKPVVMEDLLQKIRNLMSFWALKEEVVRLRRILHTHMDFGGIVGNSPALERVLDLVKKVAPSKTTVLLTGESGTGKELLARAIHTHSSLKDAPFLAVNMAALPLDLIESQLFGHEKGAFTGADRAREGIFRSVHGGTVFLDEIGELPLQAQAKLLRAIEAHEIFPVGAVRAVRADFRLVAATNKDLKEAVLQGKFRDDLFYRLNVFQIEIPPLRKRREDIPELVAHFVKRHSQNSGLRPCAVSNQAMRLITEYGWPGNVRELSNVLERATILAAGMTIRTEHLPTEFETMKIFPYNLRSAVDQFEKQHIDQVLKMAGGNREQAAGLLEVDQATLYRRLAKYRDK